MIQKELRAFLLSRSEITSITSNVFSLRLPQDSKETSIVMSITTQGSDVGHSYVSSIVRHNVTLDVYSSLLSEGVALTEGVTQLLHGYTGDAGGLHIVSARVDTSLATYEKAQELYRSIINLTINTI